MNEIVVKSLPVVDLTVFADGSKVTDLGRAVGEYGLSVYRGVLIVWDEDRDTRIIEAIDKVLGMSEVTEGSLVAASESQGELHLLWRSGVRRTFFVVGVGKDSWNVEHSC